ncbi:hypothetical protein ABG79_01661 [Caloramator mitchellensis]|uniref:DUF7916 domain-containing protein n=1 Tax=Caloramator mitchellensis TaxID=908809 RepID=A0A0R3JSL3_CALMK|nr:hypothetical protein [Caloramator mitchellensis]KRQ86459.1 hypothetical protein ABG79_01661 [Caloramator mitchellensis]
MKRFLDCFASDFSRMSKNEFIQSIKMSEGRVVVSEVIGTLQPVLVNISNAELASAFGADIILLNMFDVDNPLINGITVEDKSDYIKKLKRLTGRVVGINLEPVDFTRANVNISRGRVATAENAIKAKNLGADFIVLTGNPNNYVTNREIINAIIEIKDAVENDLAVFAGKMHSSGIIDESGKSLITIEDISSFIDAGADCILIPAPGTVPGITLDYAKELVDFIHSKGALVMTVIGTSQEGADEETIREIALMCKMAGADMHHIGDAGFAGIAIPENILKYSIAIRGKRHTYFRMAASIER